MRTPGVAQALRYSGRPLVTQGAPDMNEDTDGLRTRLTRQGEDALGKLAQDLLDNPLVNGAISPRFRCS